MARRKRNTTIADDASKIAGTPGILGRLNLFQQISRRMTAAADRGEILKTALAGVVSPLGLGWDRALLMVVDGEAGLLRTEMAFALGERPESGLKRWRELLRASRSGSPGELLGGELQEFRFQLPRYSQWLKGLKVRINPEVLALPAGGEVNGMSRLRKACRGRRLDTFLERTFSNREVTVAAIAGDKGVFGLVAADRFFSQNTVMERDVDHLHLLCREAGLSLERHSLHRHNLLRADQFEELSLLNESIMNGIDLGVACLDGEGRVKTWNRAMASLTGLGEGRVKGRRFFALFPGLRGTLIEKRAERAHSRQTPERVGHFSCFFREGRGGIFDVRIGAVRQGREAPGTVMIWEDVQLRVTLEQKARKAHRCLSSIIEHSGDAIVTLNAGGKIKSWNASAAAIFGYSAQEVLGKGFSLLYEKGKRRQARSLISRTLKEGKLINEIDTYLHKGGEAVEVSITTSTSDGEEAGGANVTAIIRDISDRRRMESQLFQTEKLASLGIMAAGMAHEINNPLTSIMMYSQILGMGPRIEPEDRSCIDRIEEDAGRIADIVNSLLVFSRPSSRESEEIDIHEAVEIAISFIQYQSGREKFRIGKDFREGLPLLRGVTTEIQEVFLNLLINARDALVEGGEIRVSSRFHKPGESPVTSLCGASTTGYVEISVSDDGSGISREHLRRIYDPFFTTKPPGKGTGLGLAVVRRLVENHQGCITVKSKIGRGTTFSVYFPAV